MGVLLRGVGGLDVDKGSSITPVQALQDIYIYIYIYRERERERERESKAR